MFKETTEFHSQSVFVNFCRHWVLMPWAGLEAALYSPAAGELGYPPDSPTPALRRCHRRL